MALCKFVNRFKNLMGTSREYDDAMNFTFSLLRKEGRDGGREGGRKERKEEGRREGENAAVYGRWIFAYNCSKTSDCCYKPGSTNGVFVKDL